MLFMFGLGAGDFTVVMYLRALQASAASLQAKLLDEQDGKDPGEMQHPKREAGQAGRLSSIIGVYFRFIKSCNLGKRNPLGGGGKKQERNKLVRWVQDTGEMQC